MLKKLVFLTVALLALNLRVEAQTVLSESAIESSTDIVQLPEAAPSTIAVRSAFGANPKLLTITPETTYFAGSQSISFAELRAIAGKGKTGLYVFYTPGNKAVSRIKIDAVVSPLVPRAKSQR